MSDIFYSSQGDLDFSGLLSELSNPTNALKAFGTYRTSQFRQSIALGQDYDGSPTAPLSERYRIQKEKAVGKKSIRVRTGQLVDSHRVEIRGNQMIESIAAPYARYIQDGTSRMSARPMMPGEGGLSGKDQEKLIELVLVDVQRSIRRSR